MNAELTIYPKKPLCVRSGLLYGFFIEHFHRQIYGGIYDPASPFADADGFREDVLAAMKKLRIPVLRWPGGCFVSAYHWRKGVGPVRTPSFDKPGGWRSPTPSAPMSTSACAASWAANPTSAPTPAPAAPRR